MSDEKNKIGGLNPLYAKKFTKNVVTHLDRLKVNLASKLVDLSYGKEEGNIPFGSLKGVVVYVNPVEPKYSSDGGIWNIGTIKNNSVSVHVRIPEIHGYMLDPSDYLSPEKENIAKSYPVFVGEENGNRMPLEGDIVLVDFYSDDKSLGGTYKGIISGVEDLEDGLGESNTKNDFWSGKMSKMNGKEVVGDGTYKPGSAKVYETIKGYYPSGKTAFLDELDPYLNNTPIAKEHVKKLIYIISSDCTSSPQYVSTQDILTIGFRRLASKGLEKLLQTHYGISIIDATKNNYQKAIEISEDPKWYQIQVDDYLSSLRYSLRKHEFKKGREIALYERIKNSRPAWLDGGPKTYEELKEIYISKKKEKGLQRIKRIEAYIGPNEVWR